MTFGHKLNLLGQVRRRQVRLCYVKLCCPRLMYRMLSGLVMDDHDPFTLTSLSLYRFVNVLYMQNVYLLLNKFCHAWSRLVTLCHHLLYFLGFYLDTVCMTLVDTT
jgi:hypothetical protein